MTVKDFACFRGFFFTGQSIETLQTSSLSVADYSSAVSEQLEIIKNALSDEDYVDLAVSLGFKIVDEDERLIDSKTALQNEIEDIAALKGEDSRELNLEE